MNQKKQRLLAKIINPQTNKTVITPMDHGVSDGPIEGLVNMEGSLLKIVKGGADAVVLHKGVYKKYRTLLKNTPTLIHISGSTVMGNLLKKVIVASPEEIVDLGATGVSIHINLGNPYEPEMLEDLGRVAGECEKLNLPLLAMMYVREEKNGETINKTDADTVKHAARVAFELGADIVKVPYTGSAETFKKVIEGCPIPVVIAGGAKGTEKEMLNSIRDCVKVGAAGVSVGRNVFQHEDVVTMLGKVRKVVHG